MPTRCRCGPTPSLAPSPELTTASLQRIRKGILEKAWPQLVIRLDASEVGASLITDEANLPQLVEK